MIKTSFDVKSIGEVLREKRKDKNLDIRQVAEVTRIRAEYLTALENNDYSSFPSEVYIKGFLKNYAKFLGINQEKALAMYRRDNMSIKKAKIEAQKIKPRRFDFTLTPEKLIIGIVAVITLSIVYYIGSRVTTILQKPELIVSAPVAISADQKGEYSTSDTKIAIKGRVSAGATLKLNGDDVITNNLEQFEVRDLELNPGVNDFIFLAESQFGRQTKVSLTINRTTEIQGSENTTNGQGSQNTQNSNTTNAKMNLTLTIITDKAYVTVKADGVSKVAQTLNVGTVKNYSANSSITIQTQRPTNLTIDINGKKYKITTSALHEWKFENGQVVQKS